jgi:hypothetical protein
MSATEARAASLAKSLFDQRRTIYGRLGYAVRSIAAMRRWCDRRVG